MTRTLDQFYTRAYTFAEAILAWHERTHKHNNWRAPSLMDLCIKALQREQTLTRARLERAHQRRQGKT